MSYPVATYEVEPAERFDWHHAELFNLPPYPHTDMVYMLAQGQFMIEGKQSNYDDAERFAQTWPESVEAWQALTAVTAGMNQEASLAI